ncbi:hypothetical protein [Streptomyces sp. NPDC047981]|uniref:hypothetical protein n=1 Tax=Streptomyces sp. NPDC047981 TaxID=3154610 RepID=UPI0034328957
MSGTLYPEVSCDGPGCHAAIHYPAAHTVTDVRRAAHELDGWHQRPGGRDICPDCWKDGQR